MVFNIGWLLSLICNQPPSQLQLRHTNGNMLTKSGVLLRGLPELVEHYRSMKDGLPVLLGDSCKAFDPPQEPPVTYMNFLKKRRRVDASDQSMCLCIAYCKKTTKRLLSQTSYLAVTLPFNSFYFNFLNEKVSVCYQM